MELNLAKTLQEERSRLIKHKATLIYNLEDTERQITAIDTVIKSLSLGAPTLPPYLGLQKIEDIPGAVADFPNRGEQITDQVDKSEAVRFNPRLVDHTRGELSYRNIAFDEIRKNGARGIEHNDLYRRVGRVRPINPSTLHSEVRRLRELGQINTYNTQRGVVHVATEVDRNVPASTPKKTSRRILPKGHMLKISEAILAALVGTDLTAGQAIKAAQELLQGEVEFETKIGYGRIHKLRQEGKIFITPDIVSDGIREYYTYSSNPARAAEVPPVLKNDGARQAKPLTAGA